MKSDTSSRAVARSWRTGDRSSSSLPHGVDPARVRPEPGLEISVKQGGDPWIVDQREGHPALGEGGTELEVVVAVAAENVDFPPGKAGKDQQAAQVVIFSLPTAEGRQGLEEFFPLLGKLEGARSPADGEAFDEKFPPVGLQGKIMLVDDAEVQVFQQGHEFVEIAFPAAVKLQKIELFLSPEGPPQVHHLLSLGPNPFHCPNVAHGKTGMEQRAILLGKAPSVSLPQGQPFLLSVGPPQEDSQLVFPGHGNPGQSPLQPVEIDANGIGFRRHGDVQAQVIGRDVDHLRIGGRASKVAAEVGFEPGDVVQGMKLSRHDDQQSQAPERQTSGGDDLDCPLPVEQGKGLDGPDELIRLHEKEFDFGKGIENLYGFPVIVAVGGNPQGLQRFLDAPPQRRDIEGKLLDALPGKQA